MTKSKFLAACALGTSLIAGGAAFAPAFAQSNATEATAQKAETRDAKKRHGHHHRMKRAHAGDKMKNVDTSNWIGIKAAYDKVEAAGYKDIHSIRLTPKGYLASAVNPDGKWAMLAVEPVEGDVKALERKAKGKKAKGDDSAKDKTAG